MSLSSKFKYAPVNGKMLVRELEGASTTESGLWIGTIKESFKQAEVVLSADEMFPVGTIVTYPNGEGMEVEYDKVKYKWMDSRTPWGKIV